MSVHGESRKVERRPIAGRRLAVLVATSCLAVAVASAIAPAAATPVLQFRLFDATDLPLGQVLWTGGKFIYVAEHTGTMKASDPQGKTMTQFAKFPQRGDEMRCAESLGPRHHWLPGLYCHTPDNRIVRVSPDGTSVAPFAALPAEAGRVSDGGIAFDNVGKFRYRLLVSSGGSTSKGGAVYAYAPNASVTKIGEYPGPGGADNILLAPRNFGTAGGQLLITIDQQRVMGRLLAMDDHGRVKLVADKLGNGINGINVIRRSPRKRPPGWAQAGYYVGDYNSGNVYFAPAAPLRGYVGDVIVSGEVRAWFWLIRPQGKTFSAQRIRTNLPTRDWSVEGTTYVP